MDVSRVTGIWARMYAEAKKTPERPTTTPKTSARGALMTMAASLTINMIVSWQRK